MTLRRAEDPPDDFFEFSAEDYARVMAGWSRAHKRAEAGLRTAKLREQEEREKASKFPAAIQRIHFPDGFIMQVCHKPPGSLHLIQLCNSLGVTLSMLAIRVDAATECSAYVACKLLHGVGIAALSEVFPRQQG